MSDQTVIVTITVKAWDKNYAKNVVGKKLNDWFRESMGPAPYPDGSLLYWGFYEPKVVNGYEDNVSDNIFRATGYES